ncbi:MAG: hypothetical protein AAF658_22280, partial [Myxococcota bacterium]
MQEGQEGSAECTQVEDESHGAQAEKFSRIMPGQVVVSTAQWRRWASLFDQTVTDDGATIDFLDGLGRIIVSGAQLPPVTDDQLIRLLTTAVKQITVSGCYRLTNESLAAVVRYCPNLSSLRVGMCHKLT